MPQDKLTSRQFIEMLTTASNMLDNNSDYINSLNIFPVPDGDTGTNMSLTLQAALNELYKTNESSIGKITEAAARGSLMGARGNSGVILSQLIRGLALGLAGKVEASPTDFARALEKGVEIAYQAVMKPVEGTILTVAKEAAKAALLASYSGISLTGVLTEAYQKGLIALEKTPELLPVLKQAGVVDAGGKGLLIIYEGFLSALSGNTNIEAYNKVAASVLDITSDYNNEEYTYCTEFLVDSENFPAELIKEKLQHLGNSLIVVGTDNMVKIHIHSNNPGSVLDLCQKYGTLHQIHINNMIDQKKNSKVEVEYKPFGVVVVVSGEGLKDIFSSLGVDVVVEGGQTMNPSTEDLLKAVEKVPANKVFLLPNNKNIIMAAEQVSSLTSKEVIIIPTKSVPQGISAMLSYEVGSSLTVNHEKMIQNMDKVLTGEVTEAARESNFSGLAIKEGDILGLKSGVIATVGQNTKTVTKELINAMLDNSGELVTLYYGHNINKEQAKKFLEELSEEFPEIEFEMHYGGQPHYYYIISVE